MCAVNHYLFVIFEFIMKERIRRLLLTAARDAHAKGDLVSDQFASIEISEPKFNAHGDLSTNFAMVSASTQKMAPRKIAETILRHIHDPENIIDKSEIAGPGFINFFINPAAWLPVLAEIYKKDHLYGENDMGRGERVQVEFVSANPTGPLHVGHGRGAVVGDAVASILAFCGYDVFREYYINDSGRQVHTLGRSVLYRCMELSGKTVVFPEECYQGDYIYDLAKEILKEKGDWLLSTNEEESVVFCAEYAAEKILAIIREDLDILGIAFDNWFSEKSLYAAGKVEDLIGFFRQNNLIHEKDGALWFKTSEFGDEKDRVVVKENGETTYFASDIAYHKDKFDRGFEKIIDVWGADHHGYIPRIRACIQASGKDEKQFVVILTQLVNLLRAGQPVAMGKRSGQFVTLREVIDEVGRDAARFIFLTRHYDSPLDFDLEIAKQQSNDNPVYYVQYVHARISSIIKKAKADWGIEEVNAGEESIALIREPEEIQIIKHLARYPETVKLSAECFEPHRIAFYLMELAAAFHAYYNKHRVLTDDPSLTAGRLYLIVAVRIVIRNGLTLLGVSAPESM
jgi:arginyl-tRNA synthetase